jgi:sugar phosphate isomerase/epimerase
VKINLDTGNYDEPDLYAGLEASLADAPHVVAKVHDLDGRGRPEEFDYDRIFEMLKRHRYHGFVTLEYEGAADERQAVPKAVDFLRRTAMKHHL